MKKLNLHEAEVVIAAYLQEAKEQYVGKDVTVPRGKYAGRRGNIYSISICSMSGTIQACVRPYRVKPLEGQDPLLWQHQDARSYWTLSECLPVL